MQLIKKMFLLISICSLLASNSFAQSSEKTMAIEIDPLDLIFGTLPLTFSFALGDRVSLGINANGHFFTLGSIKSLGGGAGLHAKFHLSNTAFADGWYLKPGIASGFARLGSDSNKLDRWYFQGYATAGYDWVWDTGFSIGLGLGIGYKHWFGDLNALGTKRPFGLGGIAPTGDFKIGWAF